MTIERMIELLKIEHECMLRNSHGNCTHKCEDCDLVQDDGELHEMYLDVIGILKAQEPTLIDLQTINNKVKYGYCPKCNHILDGIYNKQFCGSCGQSVKWDG